MTHKITMRAIAITYTPYVTRSIAVAGGITALALFLYAVFLLEAVVHTAGRTEAQREIQTVTSHLSTLEEKYLALSSSMTPDRARDLGYVAPADVSRIYVSPTGELSAQPSGTSLTLRTQ